MELVASQPLDLLVQGALVFDGESAWKQANIGVRGDRIVSVSSAVPHARQVIQADGLWAVPGFVDMHNHSDLTLLRLRASAKEWHWSEEARLHHNALRQGVTTVVTGNCGDGFARLADWKALFARAGFATNVCHLVPYGSLRRDLMRDQPDEGPLTARCIDMLRDQLNEQLGQGAVGFSTALDSLPQCYATTRELIEYCRVVAHWRGTYVTHLRHESAPAILKAIAEAIEIAEQTGVRVHLGHLRLYRGGDASIPKRMLALLAEARSRGVDITASQNPYTTIGGMFGPHFLTHLLSNLQPDQDLARLSAPSARESALAFVIRAIGAEQMTVCHHPQRPTMQGRTLAELALTTRRTALEILMELYELGVAYLVMNVFSEEAMEILMRPDYVFTSSNGELALADGACTHPRSFGAFPRKLRRYALDRRTISNEQALASMSGRPAEFLGLTGRGRIEVGFIADFLVLNPNLVGDELDYVQPKRYPSGFEQVIVNGRPALGAHAEVRGRLVVRQ